MAHLTLGVGINKHGVYTWTFKGCRMEVPDRSGLGRNQPGDPFEGAGICHIDICEAIDGKRGPG